MSRLNFSYNETLDVLTIEGVQYHGDLFRSFAFEHMLPLNEPFVIERRFSEGDHMIVAVRKLKPPDDDVPMGGFHED